MSHAEVAKKRMGIIADSINKAKNPDVEMLINKCCFEWGTTPKTIKGYIEILKGAGMVKL